jgi:hypothetical protein
VCLPGGGVCLGSSAAGEGGCASDLITVGSSSLARGALYGASVAFGFTRGFESMTFTGQKGDNVADDGSWFAPDPTQANATRVAPTVPAQVLHGGRGGGCMATVVSGQKMLPTTLAGSNAGNGYLKLVIVASG